MDLTAAGNAPLNTPCIVLTFSYTTLPYSRYTRRGVIGQILPTKREPTSARYYQRGPASTATPAAVDVRYGRARRRRWRALIVSSLLQCFVHIPIIDWSLVTRVKYRREIEVPPQARTVFRPT